MYINSYVFTHKLMHGYVHRWSDTSHTPISVFHKHEERKRGYRKQEMQGRDKNANTSETLLTGY